MAHHRFLYGVGDVVADGELPDRAAELTWARDAAEHDDVQRVEYLGPEGDWRWAGPLQGRPRLASSPNGPRPRPGRRPCWA